MAPSTAMKEADAWTENAARMPLAFAQVREDPRLDLQLVAALPREATVAMIASGGETAACLATTGIKRLFLVDMNPAQLALTKLKLFRSRIFPEVEANLPMLGHLRMPTWEREQLLMIQLSMLRLDLDALGPIKQVAKLGPDHAGRYEMVFAQLRETLAPHRPALKRMLRRTRPQVIEEPLGAAIDDAFDRVMSLPNLVALFGTEATQNPVQPFSRHFAERTRDAVSRLPAHSNPFLWQIFAGRFPPGHPYDWLSGSPRPNPDQEQIYLHGKMRDVLDGMEPHSCDLVHLSNILDWLKPEDAVATLRSAARVLKSGGRVIIRQLNSSLDLPGLPSGFRWDLELGRQMRLRDRSFFYKAIHVGRQP